MRFVTGHCQGSEESLDLNWKSLADPDTTLVVYMGLANLDTIAQRLIEAGLPGSTPAAAIQSGTTAKQRVVLTTLAKLPERVRAEDLKPPTLMVIGAVAELATELEWFRPHAVTGHDAHG